jgi:hypothetical protein
MRHLVHVGHSRRDGGFPFGQDELWHGTIELIDDYGTGTWLAALAEVTLRGTEGRILSRSFHFIFAQGWM